MNEDIKKEMLDMDIPIDEINQIDKKIEKSIKEYMEDKPEEFLKQVANKDLLEELVEYDKQRITPVPVDRYGSCPACKSNWDGGDIFEKLHKLDVFSLKSHEDMIKIAGQYGWTPQNMKRFSTVIGLEINIIPTSEHSISGKFNFYQCPDCLHVFNSQTSEHFYSVTDAKNSLYE